MLNKKIRYLFIAVVAITTVIVIGKLLREQEKQRIETRPYIQLASPTAFTVRWNSTKAGVSDLRYGTSPDRLFHSVSTAEKTRYHQLRLTGLQPDTAYYYQVNYRPETYRYKTPPATGSETPFRAWVLGDAGKNNQQTRQVLSGYEHFNGKPTDLILLLGDNAYGSGTFAEYSQTLFNVFGEHFSSSAVWPTVGNHDVRYHDGEAYFRIFSMPEAGQIGGSPSHTPHYYSFDYGNTHFISLDTELSSLEKNSPMHQWLAMDLAQNQLTWVVVLLHRPPYSKGSHDSDNPENRKMQLIRENFVPLFDQYNVDLVIAGHSHSYERSIPLHGHYGDSASLTEGMITPWQTDHQGIDQLNKSGNPPAQATVYVVAGSASKTYAAPLNHPAHQVALATPGSLVIDVNGKLLTVSFINTNGTIADRFMITR